MSSERLRVILADDRDLVLEGLRGLLANELDMEVIGTATDGASLLAALEHQQPDVVVMDLQMCCTLRKCPTTSSIAS